jgi:hypothetical protein
VDSRLRGNDTNYQLLFTNYKLPLTKPMPEIKNENMNINLQEIEELEKRLADKKAAIGAWGEKLSAAQKKEAEISKENMQETPSSAIPSALQAKMTAVKKAAKKKAKKEIDELKNLDTAGQVKKLSFLAFEKGIRHSIRVARSLNDAYLLDALHDKLIGDLHQELVEKGKLKEI